MEGHELKERCILHFEFECCDTRVQKDFIKVGQFSSRIPKKSLEHFLNGLNWGEFENRKTAEILINTVKSRRLGHSKQGSSAVF